MNPTNTLTPSTQTSNTKRDWLKWVGGAALTPVLASTSALQTAHAGPRAGYFPNTFVQTHDGKNLRFYDDLVQGKVVVFSMMYSVCTGICPGNTANLRQVQQALGDRLGKDVSMVSMTLQPQFDTPKALKDYVKRYEIGPGWTFITGKPEEMEVIRRRMGFYNSNPSQDADLANHTGMVRIGNEKLDRWFMMPALAKPAQIARAILQS
jgi:protein SCO1